MADNSPLPPTSLDRTVSGCRSGPRSRLIVVLNEKLLQALGDDVTQDQAFAHANEVLKDAVGGISDIIHIPGTGQKSTSRT